ncbi:MAG: hypothetical protein K0S33_2821 [Bacteroidetes bacterium]|jgi:hypothetical protein|nr:hypothetical protein [Bacteroidota bacterium]
MQNSRMQTNKIKIPLLIFILLSTFFAFAQDPQVQEAIDTSRAVKGVKKLKWDTNYYKKYSDRLIIAVYQSARNYHIELDPQNPADSGKANQNYYADANKVTGIEVDFDKISVSFGFRSEAPQNAALKGKTTYSNFGVSVGGNKWFLEGSYRKFKGFYDKNTSAYDTTYDAGDAYYQNSSMVNESVKAKFFYFTNNKRFAYKSSYTCVYRQIRSSASWVLTSNLYYNSLRTDSGFVSPLVRKYYDAYANLKGMRMLGVSGGGGFSVNIVLWKAVFFNLTGIANLESQWRKNDWLDNSDNEVAYFTSSFDLRASLGINNKNFFLTLSSLNDMNLYNSGKLFISSTFYSGNFTIGYRFKVKYPTWYKQIQASKLYNMI